MKRFLRRVLRNVIPASVKDRYRARQFAARPAGANISIQFVESAAAPVAIIERSIRLVITQEEKPNLLYHLQNNGACVEEMAGFLRHARTAKLLFDVGAHKGLFALIFAALGSEKRVVAYEPSAPLARRARELGELNRFNDRIMWRPEAIGERNGPAFFKTEPTGFVAAVSANRGGASQLPMRTLDAECERLDLWPDLLKIDVEGFEWEALCGAPKLLKRKPVVFLELHLHALEERGVEPKQVVNLLADCGYRFETPRGKLLRRRQVYDSLDSIVRFVAL